jgi:hypothetical protein
MIESGRWVLPNDRDLWIEIFGEARPGHGCCLLTIDAMRRESPPENGMWMDDRAYLYLGEPDDANPPGDADPNQLVIIGDLGPDQPIGLDYRTSPEPRVIYLGASSTKWRTVANDPQEFVAGLRL